MKSHDHILSYILIALFVLSTGYAYYRFVIVSDYMVAYEGKCEPSLHSCFAGCDNDGCADVVYPYAKMQKSETDLYAECGKDITNCDAANTCLPQDGQDCTVSYCDPKTGDTCATSIGESSSTPQDITL